MDVEKQQELLISILRNSFSPDFNERRNAERFFETMEANVQFMCTLFQMSYDLVELDLTIRQAAAIHLRQMVDRRWKIISREGGGNLKQFMHDKLITALSTNKLIRSHIEACLTAIIKEDYPSEWPTLPQQLIQLLTSQDVVKIQCALLTTRMVILIYAQSSTNSTVIGILNGFLEAVFPLLMTLFEYLQQQQSLQASEMKLLLCKIFWSVTQLHVPSYFTIERFQGWMNAFTFIMAQPTPLPSNQEEEQIVSLMFTTKKWIARIFDRFFHRYSKQVHKESTTTATTTTEVKNKQKDSTKLALYFMENYSIKILEIILNLLSSHATTTTTTTATGSVNIKPKFPPKLTTACLNFVISSINPSHTWNVVKDHIEKLFQNVFFPILLFTEEDLKLYHEDPHEFIKRQFDESIMMHDPRATVLGFLADIIPLRGEQYLDLFMKLILSVLSSYEATPPQQRNFAQKEAALSCVSCLEKYLKNSLHFKNGLEDFLFKHVIPELSSPHGILRSKACWTFGQFGDIPFQNENNVAIAVRSVLECLVHPHLPVNVNGAIAFPKVIQSPSVAAKFEPSLGNILEAYLRLMSLIDNDELMESLQALVKTFSSNIPQYAPNLIKKLTEQYLRMISDKTIFSGKPYDPHSTSLYTAIHCLNTIKTVMDMVEEAPPMVMDQILPHLHPLLMTISPDTAEVILDYIHLMAQYSYTVTTVHDSMWQVFERMCQSCLEWAIDFLPEILVPFDNFISKSPDAFLQKNFLPQICHIFQMSLDHKESIDWTSASCRTQSVMVSGTKLIQAPLFKCRAQIDSVIPAVLQLTTEKLREATTNEAKAALLEVVSGAIFCNATVTFAFLEKFNITRDLFNLWISLLKDYVKSLTQIKCSILGLSTILYLPYSQIPICVQEGLPSIVVSIIDLQENFLDILREVEIEKPMDEIMERGEKEKPFILQKYADDEDIGSDLFGYPLTGPVIEKFEKMFEELSDDDEDERQDYNAFFGSLDELVYFVDGLRFFTQNHPTQYNQIIASLDESHNNKLQQQINTSQQRKQQPQQ